MAGIFGQSGADYWDRQISGALDGIKSRPLPPVVTNNNAGSASITPTGIDWSKIQLGANQPQEEEESFFSKAVNAPVIKQVLDAVSVFNYAGANIADNMVESAEQGKGPLSYVGDVVEGIGEGVSGAVGNEENAKGYGEVIRRIQGNMGVDTESTGAKWASGLGGFAGDVLLDPTTYIGVGAIKGVAGGVKNVSKLSAAKKINTALDALTETAPVANRVSVPGRLNPTFKKEIEDIRMFRGDNTPAPDGTLRFDSIRPSRKAAQIEEVRLDFQARNPGVNIRNAATGKIDAFKAGYAESMQKFRLDERARKLNRLDNKAARKMMKINPEQAIVDLIRIPYENLSEAALSGASDSRLIKMAEGIIKTSDDIMGISSRSPKESKAMAADLAETVKNEQVSIEGALNSLWGSKGPRQILHKGGKPTQFTPKQSKENVRAAVVAKNTARMEKAARRRQNASQRDTTPAQQFFEDADAVKTANALSDSGRVVEDIPVAKSDTVEPTDTVKAETTINNEVEKPGSVTPQERQRAAEEFTDLKDDYYSNRLIYSGMKAREAEEVQAVEAAFSFANAKLPDGKGFNGSSEFYYPKSVIDQVGDLPMNSPDDVFLMLGIHPNDIPIARMDDLSSTSTAVYSNNAAKIIKHIRNLKSDVRSSKRYEMSKDNPLWQTVSELEDIFGVEGPRAVASELDKIKSTVLFREAMKYATGERITKRDLQGITDAVGEDYIKASLKLVPTEEAAEVPRLIREESEQILDAFNPHIKGQIDARIMGAMKYQLTSQGKNITDRVGATTDGDNLGAIINHHWNTHAHIQSLGEIHKLLRRFKFSGDFDTLEKMDEVTLAAFRYYDSRLKEAGVDAHLTNMAEPYTRKVSRKFELADGTTDSVDDVIQTGQYAVRLGISDILESLTPDLRAQFVYGKINLRPTQWLDLGEALVRGAREIDPLTGGVDLARAKTLAKLGLLGERGKVRVFEKGTGITRLVREDESITDLIKAGHRVMAREVHTNLDDNSRIHVIQQAINNKLVDADGKRILSRDETDEAEVFFLNEIDPNTGKKIVNPPEEAIRRIAALLDGKDLDGDSIFNSALDAIKNTEFDEIVEAFFHVDSSGRMPFNKLVERSIQNSMLVGRRITEDVMEFSQENLRRLEDAINSNSVARTIEEVATDSAALNKVSPEAKQMIKENKEADIRRQIPDERVRESLVAQASVANKVTPENAAKVREELVTEPELTPADINKIDPKTPEDATVLMENYYDATAAQLSLDFANKWGMRFHNTYGMPHSGDIVTMSSHVIPSLMSSVTDQFKAWEKAGIRANDLKMSLNTIKSAVQEGSAVPFEGVTKQVYDFFNIMFDTSKYNFFKANGIEGPAMNRFKFNLEKSFDKEIAQSLGKLKDDGEDISKLWTQLPINDPYTFSSKLFYVYAKTAQETQIAADFSARFGVYMTPEMAKKHGYVKIIDSGEKNIFARMINTEKYYPQEIAEEVVYINNMLDADRAFTGQVQSFMENVWDPVVSVLKLGQTSMKPGHHVMSVVGDMWRNTMLTGSAMTREYKQAAHMVGYIRHKRKNEAPMDALKRKLEEYTEYEFKGVASGANNENHLTLMLGQGNAKVATKVSMDYIVSLAERHGVLFAPHSGGVSEDLLSGASAGFEGKGLGKSVKKVADKLLDNRMTAAINAFSADRDGLTRGALFLHYLQSRKFKSLEDAAIYAGDMVRKAAPVASDLAAWESKWMRRKIFYYTWLRGITPRVVETLLTRPGQAMIPSKGMYELADANGLDPNSFGDPMNDEIKSDLPDYYAGRVMGPAYQDAETGDYWGFSTASPTIDVLNTFGTDISAADFVKGINPYKDGGEENAYQKLNQTFIGMVTPWVKMPYEMSTGRRLDTGAPIDSNWQYLIDQNSWTRTASKVTGQIAPGLDRTETRFRGGHEDPAGNALHEFLANFMSNSQLMNYSEERLKKSAEFQQRDEESELSKLMSRIRGEQE